ncbi:MAG TPA: tetratricopeptide repeat protein, partial [Verrucomicrobiota bacterium]|nr:tetratricopeptide repeat protein [Verrucomicrobiota bacterium]
QQLDGLFELISRSVEELAPTNRTLIVESPRILGARSKFSADYVLESGLRGEAPGIVELSLRLVGPHGRELGSTNLPLPGGDLSRGELPAAMLVIGWLGGHPRPADETARDPQVAAWRLTALGLASARTPARLDRAVKLLQNVVEQAPDYAEAWADLALLRKSLYGDFRQPAQLDAAEHAARMALRLDGTLVSATTSLAYIELERGRIQEAWEIARRLHARRPNDAEALRLLAETEFRLGRPGRAAELFAAAIRARPEDWRVHDALAHFHLRAGDAANAVAAFRRVVQLNPRDPRSHSNLGGALFVAGDWRGAELEFRRALELGGTYEALSNLGTFLFFERQDYAAAADMFRRAVAWNREDHVVRGNLADALRLLGDAAGAREASAEALALARRDLDINPGDRATRAMAAYYLATLGQPGESAAELTLLGPREACDTATLFTGVLALEIAGRRDEALAWLGDALARGHALEEARQHPDLAELRRDPRFIALSSGTPRP